MFEVAIVLAWDYPFDRPIVTGNNGQIRLVFDQVEGEITAGEMKQRHHTVVQACVRYIQNVLNCLSFPVNQFQMSGSVHTSQKQMGLGAKSQSTNQLFGKVMFVERLFENDCGVGFRLDNTEIYAVRAS